jgi:hypothetical protein
MPEFHGVTGEDVDYLVDQFADLPRPLVVVNLFDAARNAKNAAILRDRTYIGQYAARARERQQLYSPSSRHYESGEPVKYP